MLLGNQQELPFTRNGVNGTEQNFLTLYVFWGIKEAFASCSSNTVPIALNNFLLPSKKSKVLHMYRGQKKDIQFKSLVVLVFLLNTRYQGLTRNFLEFLVVAVVQYPMINNSITRNFQCFTFPEGIHEKFVVHKSSSKVVPVILAYPTIRRSRDLQLVNFSGGINVRSFF